MHRRNEHGFTLVELMVVIVLIGLLAGTVTYAVFPALFKGKITAAKGDLHTFKGAIGFYYVNHTKFPETLEELVQPDPENGYPSGYLDGTTELPLDPWKQEYGYQKEGDSYEIWSLGPDMQENTDDDLRVTGSGQ